MNTTTDKHSLRVVLATIGLAVVAGCATQPTPHLREAREEYSQARSGYANEYAPDEVLRAKTALDDAERVHDRRPGSEMEKHLAYIAHRRAMLAKSTAAERMAEAESAKAASAREDILLSQRESLKTVTERLTLETEALKRLGATVRTEDNKTIISLTGEVLFRFDEAELLPIAKQRLAAVAKVLKETSDGGQPFVIEGHADSRGTDEYNEGLSQRRAEAVRDYLVAQGVSEDMVETVGKGEQDPIASNSTAEGRANNRRVEIVIDEGETRTSQR